MGLSEKGLTFYNKKSIINLEKEEWVACAGGMTLREKRKSEQLIETSLSDSGPK